MHRTNRVGPGEEWADARTYRAGDDVRRIDWSATARAGEIQVRDTLADRGLRLTLVVDCSPSMQFGTDTLTKADLALAVAAAASIVATRQGDSVAAMLVRPGGSVWVEPGSGVAHVNVLLRSLERSFATEGPASLVDALRRAGGTANAPGLFVVVSDFLDEGSARALRNLTARHRVIAVVVSDRREFDLVPAGLIEVYDPETEEQLLLDTDSPRFVERFRSIAIERRARRDAELRESGVEVHEIVCGPEWLRDVARTVTGGPR